MAKELLAERIYTALKNTARGAQEISISRGIAAASVATNMPLGLVRQWVSTMAMLGWVELDGYTIWLSRDFGPRPPRPKTAEELILEAEKVQKKQGPAAGSEPTEK